MKTVTHLNYQQVSPAIQQQKQAQKLKHYKTTICKNNVFSPHPVFRYQTIQNDTNQFAVEITLIYNHTQGAVTEKTPVYLTSLNNFSDSLLTISNLRQFLFKCILPSEEEDIVHRQQGQSYNKQHYRIWPRLLFKELAQHPYTVRHDPYTYRYIMKQLGHAAARAPHQVYGHTQRRQYHGNATGFEFQRPTGVFHQPEQYMPVFQHTVSCRPEQLFSTHLQQNKGRKLHNSYQQFVIYHINMTTFPYTTLDIICHTRTFAARLSKSY